jgi:hypothetical protein
MSICPDNMTKVYLAIKPNEDYHFYRQNPDGFWSHKRGWGPGSYVTEFVNYDGIYSDCIIPDPEVAARILDYTMPPHSVTLITIMPSATIKELAISCSFRVTKRTELPEM